MSDHDDLVYVQHILNAIGRRDPSTLAPLLIAAMN